MIQIMLVFLIAIIFSTKWIMDTLNFHYVESIFFKLKPQEYFNPEMSYINKYNHKNKFTLWLFENPLVFITDFYHLIQFVNINCICILFCLNPLLYKNPEWYSNIVVFAMCRFIYWSSGFLFYKNLK